MIKSIDEVKKLLNNDYCGMSQKDILILWALEIVQECQDNFECDFEECPEEESVVYDMKTGKCIHPVMVRASIDRVKEQIQ